MDYRLSTDIPTADTSGSTPSAEAASIRRRACTSIPLSTRPSTAARASKASASTICTCAEDVSYPCAPHVQSRCPHDSESSGWSSSASGRKPALPRNISCVKGSHEPNTAHLPWRWNCSSRPWMVCDEDAMDFGWTRVIRDRRRVYADAVGCAPSYAGGPRTARR